MGVHLKVPNFIAPVLICISLVIALLLLIASFTWLLKVRNIWRELDEICNNSLLNSADEINFCKSLDWLDGFMAAGAIGFTGALLQMGFCVAIFVVHRKGGPTKKTVMMRTHGIIFALTGVTFGLVMYYYDEINEFQKWTVELLEGVAHSISIEKVEKFKESQFLRIISGVDLTFCLIFIVFILVSEEI